MGHVLFEAELTEDLPDTRPHADSSADLAELVCRLVDIEGDVRAVLLQKQSEDKSTESGTTGQSICSQNKGDYNEEIGYDVRDRDTESGRGRHVSEF